jgi:hypothetical protein
MSQDDLKRKVRDVAEVLLDQKGYISPVDLLIKMGRLSAKDYEDWRRGRIPYLEKACVGSLGKLSTIMMELKLFGKEKELKQSWTAYNRLGKGQKQRLRFSKTGDSNIEKEYATHYLRSFKKEPLQVELETMGESAAFDDRPTIR